MARRKNKGVAAVVDPAARERQMQEEHRERSYERAFNHAERQQAIQQGAADGAAAAMTGSDPALERARLRALGGGAAPAPVAPPIKEKNTRIIQQPDGSTDLGQREASELDDLVAIVPTFGTRPVNENGTQDMCGDMVYTLKLKPGLSSHNALDEPSRCLLLGMCTVPFWSQSDGLIGYNPPKGGHGGAY